MTGEDITIDVEEVTAMALATSDPAYLTRYRYVCGCGAVGATWFTRAAAVRDGAHHAERVHGCADQEVDPL